tara:strand:+ start:1996 stop:2175 length:180 start_codon:yes stop_codon:yes gene_type:complete
MIQTVEKTYDMNNNPNGYRVTFTDGTISNVPHNEANRHYQEILEWVADGNTITDNGGAE